MKSCFIPQKALANGVLTSTEKKYANAMQQLKRKLPKHHEWAMDHLFVKANYLILYFTTSVLPSMTHAADHFEIEGCAHTKTHSITKTG